MESVGGGGENRPSRDSIVPWGCIQRGQSLQVLLNAYWKPPSAAVAATKQSLVAPRSL